MKTLVIAASNHDTAGELVNDEHLSVLDNIVNVALHNTVRLYCNIDMVRKSEVVRVGKVFNIEILFRLGNTVFCQRGYLALFVNNIVGALLLRNLLKVHFGVRFGNTQAFKALYKVVCKRVKL